jgi:transcription-repair coupling factor (superfamily II helicase)
MRDMADELLRLYAERKLADGFPYSPDSNWQREFEDAFEFTPTKDQTSAAAEIKRDMESPHPMDRLLCGDVGFGKTEVAMRAAFKALGDGKQVAILTPTTVLCLQHFETFKRRFAPFPVRVEMFSRFRAAKELDALADQLAAGSIDIAIGTHRLLSNDVKFKDLGLLVVDEEQRFGVRHKERLKQLRKSVDVLTMSATPIPRTLHMSMLGVRDLSIIETPPKDRLAIHTVVAKFNPDMVKNAIEQEVARGGQVYYLHNRVESIYARAAFLQELIPDLRVGVGHGQMSEAALEKTILGFMRHEFDVFVCTTIVENGIDIALANTIIVENAERYGLSELYQLRGRVGRSNRRAYAYLLVPEDVELTDVARKRLAALREFSDLGAGFKIAALDLELRGAGSILGGEQHGHINSVGYDMYMSLLEQSVKELRGEQVTPEIHTTINLGLDLRIPSAYIADENQRLRAYKKIADTAGAEAAGKVLEELEDRYGPAPGAVKLLLRFSAVKAAAEKLGVESVEKKGAALMVKFHPESAVDPMMLMELVHSISGAQFAPNGIMRVPLGASAAGTAETIALLEELFGRLIAVPPPRDSGH